MQDPSVLSGDDQSERTAVRFEATNILEEKIIRLRHYTFFNIEGGDVNGVSSARKYLMYRNMGENSSGWTSESISDIYAHSQALN